MLVVVRQLSLNVVDSGETHIVHSDHQDWWKFTIGGGAAGSSMQVGDDGKLQTTLDGS